MYDIAKVKQYIQIILEYQSGCEITFPDANIWFTESNYRELCNLLAAIELIKDMPYRELFEVILSSILNRTCNKRNTWNLGYLSDNILPNKASSLSVKKEFERKCRLLIPAIKETSNFVNKSQVKQADASIYQSAKLFDMIITSPPYPFAVDFAKNNRLSYYIFGEDIEEAAIAETGARNKRNKKNCEADFFAEMQRIYLNLFSLVREGGYFCMTVSDTKRKNQQINFVQWLIDLFQANNWSIAENTIRQLQHQSMGHKRIAEEHLLVFQKHY